MKICGIISEYNPFHKGHLYHIQKTKELTGCDAIVAIMSGDFVQRGTPSLIDKWERARLALENEVDLVLELPSLFSISSAEFFSFGAVSLLDSLGVIDYISFGSEIGDKNFLKFVSEILLNEPSEYVDFLKAYLDLGISYALARNKALEDYINLKNLKLPREYSENFSSILNSSNNILGFEYCKSLLKLNSNIEIFTLKREGGNYNSTDLNSSFSSATSIRESLKSKNHIEELKLSVPSNVFQYLDSLYKENSNAFTFEDSIFPYLKYKALCSKNNLKDIPEATEGLDNKIINALIESNSYEEALHKIKSKRYTLTRIRRILCQYFIGFEEFPIKDLRKEKIPYGRVLGFNSKGREILKLLKKTSSIPIYAKLPKEHNMLLKMDIRATKAYSLINTKVNYNDDYLKSPIIIK